MANCTNEVTVDGVLAPTSDGMCVTASGVQDDASLYPVRMEPLIQSHAIVAYVYIALMSTALLIGAGGNVMILLVIGAMRNFQRTGKIFVINLALADLCVAIIADPMCVVAVVKGEAWFDDKLWLCETVAAMCLTACFCAFLSLMLCSINRYVFICHNTLYDTVFSTKACVVACLATWVAAFAFEFPNFVGWGGHYFDPKSHQCIWDRTTSFSYTIFVSMGLIFTPLVIMLICYVLIFRHIYITKRNLFAFDSDPFRIRKTWLETLQTSRMLLGIFFVFLVCWVPYGIVIVFDFYQELSLEMHLFVTMLAHLHSSANCIVYTISNHNFRSVVKRRVCCLRGSAFLSDSSSEKTTDNIKISSIHTSTNSVSNNYSE